MKVIIFLLFLIVCLIMSDKIKSCTSVTSHVSSSMYFSSGCGTTFPIPCEIQPITLALADKERAHCMDFPFTTILHWTDVAGKNIVHCLTCQQNLPPAVTERWFKEEFISKEKICFECTLICNSK